MKRERDLAHPDGTMTEAAETLLTIENTPLALAVILPDATIAFANRAFRHLVGGDVAGVDIHDLVNVDCGHDWEDVLRAQGATPDRVKWLRRCDGDRVPAHIATVAVADDDGNVRCVIARALAA
jgi:PAS domain-containing protein